MCYTQRKIEGGDGALRESDDTNFLRPNGQSRNLNIYDKSIKVYKPLGAHSSTCISLISSLILYIMYL